MTKILIIEDDVALGKGIALALKQANWEIAVVTSIGQAKAAMKNTMFQLILLDINLPDGNGLDLLNEIINRYHCPVIIITANDLESDVVTGLELGADDYITKPFSLMILRARVNAQLRRHSAPSDIYGDTHYSFDFERLKFSVIKREIELSKSEIKLLHKLVVNRGQIVTREQLIDCLWSRQSQFVDENALSVTINRLRKKLACQQIKKPPIKTVYGLGYQWDAQHDL